MYNIDSQLKINIIMKTKSQLLILAILFLLLGSCKPEYKIAITELENVNAPSLQSFAHARSGSEWLLFAGRTNQSDDNGGIHDMKKGSNYANTSFPPTSFNKNIFVYNVETDEAPQKISIIQMLDTVASRYKSYSNDTLQKYKSVFKNTNALVRQEGDFVYVLGGYGAIDFATPKNGYITYDHVAKIHVPSLIALVKEDYDAVVESKLFAFGQNKNLVSTGGELYIVDEKFYLVGGHNFGNTALKGSQGQKYVDAVYPFSLETDAHVLNITVDAPISDVSNPKALASDTTSVFRRRDGPVTASLYYNSDTDKLDAGIAIYAGVFKPGEDLTAWNDAIYVHPNLKGTNNKPYTYDTAYNQKNYNVYSCPDVVGYDAKNKTLHTFLLGGIGDGNLNGKEKRLSGFTNTGVHIQLNVDGKPLKSTNTVFSKNLFGDSEKNAAPFYGGEAILFKNSNAISIEQTKEIIDLNSLFAKGNSVDVGYVFGGIESFKSHPGTYGRKFSRASSKVWKVTFTKK